MKTFNTKVMFISLGLLVLLYCGSYIRSSLKGHYEPASYGLLERADGKPILAPKSALGYDWHPELLQTRNGEAPFTSHLYLPLLILDRKFWHTKERMQTFRYPVRPYFNDETRAYEEIVPQ